MGTELLHLEDGSGESAVMSGGDSGLLDADVSTQAKEFIVEAIKTGVSNQKEMQALKNLYCLRYKRTPFTNVELIRAYRSLLSEGVIEDQPEFMKLLRKRGVRSKSGIASVTVITKHYACPGTCIFCPNEPKMPKSYLSNEPAVMRAILNDFDAFRQTRNRLESLEISGHHTDKIDVIVSGGTFSYYPREYQKEFTLGIFRALNSEKFISEEEYSIPNTKKGGTLEEEQKINETAKHRCIGLSFETRPDYVTEEEIINLRNLGCTKVEIGVQSLNDEVLKLNKRGHNVAETQRAFQLLRDAGFKINAHMMPNLYGSNMENDLNDFRELFENPAYKPDWLKIYPCMVVPWSELAKIFERGEYKPYTDSELTDLIIRLKQIVPEYCRITRLYRDIPAPTVLGGCKISNLRQLVHEKMGKMGIKCRCIRCREIKDEKIDGTRVDLRVQEFEASGGHEFFISFNDSERDKLCSLLRLRFTSYAMKGDPHFIRELEGASIIREVHTYGEQVRVASTAEGGASQHVGLGRRMIAEAERISKEAGFKKIAVISGIGVREYYRKLGYELEGSYMVKNF